MPLDPTSQVILQLAGLVLGVVAIRFGMRPIYKLVDMIVEDLGELARRHWPASPGRIFMDGRAPPEPAKALAPAIPTGAIKRDDGPAYRDK